MATAFLTSHHGFRRDIRQFAGALRRAPSAATTSAARRDGGGVEALPQDAARPPHDGGHGDVPQHQGAAPGAGGGDRRADGRTPQDRSIAGGGRSRLRRRWPRERAPRPSRRRQRCVALLDSHLAIEETHIVPFLREAKAFPPPGQRGRAGDVRAGLCLELARHRARSARKALRAAAARAASPSFPPRAPPSPSAARRSGARRWPAPSRTPIPDGL